MNAERTPPKKAALEESNVSDPDMAKSMSHRADAAATGDAVPHASPVKIQYLMTKAGRCGPALAFVALRLFA